MELAARIGSISGFQPKSRTTIFAQFNVDPALWLMFFLAQMLSGRPSEKMMKKFSCFVGELALEKAVPAL